MKEDIALVWILLEVIAPALYGIATLFLCLRLPILVTIVSVIILIVSTLLTMHIFSKIIQEFVGYILTLLSLCTFVSIAMSYNNILVSAAVCGYAYACIQFTIYWLFRCVIKSYEVLIKLKHKE